MGFGDMQKLTVTYETRKKFICYHTGFLIFEFAVFGLCATICYLIGTSFDLLVKYFEEDSWPEDEKSWFQIEATIWFAGYGLIYWFFVMRRLYYVCQWCFVTDPRLS